MGSYRRSWARSFPRLRRTALPRRPGMTCCWMIRTKRSQSRGGRPISIFDMRSSALHLALYSISSHLVMPFNRQNFDASDIKASRHRLEVACHSLQVYEGPQGPSAGVPDFPCCTTLHQVNPRKLVTSDFADAAFPDQRRQHVFRTVTMHC